MAVCTRALRCIALLPAVYLIPLVPSLSCFHTASGSGSDLCLFAVTLGHVKMLMLKRVS